MCGAVVGAVCVLRLCVQLFLVTSRWARRGVCEAHSQAAPPAEWPSLLAVALACCASALLPPPASSPVTHPSRLPWGLAFALLSAWNALPFLGFLSFFFSLPSFTLVFREVPYLMSRGLLTSPVSPHLSFVTLLPTNHIMCVHVCVRAVEWPQRTVQCVARTRG